VLVTLAAAKEPFCFQELLKTVGSSVPRRSPHPSLWCCSRSIAVYDLPTWTVSLCLAVDSARTAVGRSTTQARQSGTRCQIIRT